ncbi:uncharacterized protein [Zea mays]|uniref:DUF7963 domain-containing protein n=1 Tax=Zea mays TaxID=4577 RepID=A0A096RC05_MAIZE|nr:uncharacterized protein LOC103626874 [Zea mays]AQK69732.1 hypothetical protein ZEAMMB73_Zm00001d015889 [Zea mays]|eukprot:XP_008645450.1 uncharacterized protein LOC103626874 [Zea mays]
MSTATAKEEEAAAAAAPAMVGEEAAARAALKRYEALLTVRAKAVKGKGAWYWAHLEPVLVPPAETGMPPKAVKLRCALCSAVFSASNPSRTASEHLKRGTCPNFASPPPGPAGASALQPAPTPTQQLALPSNSTASSPVPISSIAPSSSHHHSNPHHHHHQQQQSGSRKRHSMPPAYTPAEPVSHHHHLVVVDPSLVYPSALPALPAPPPPHQSELVLSGGKGDFSALAMLEDSVKRLKSPKASPVTMMPKPQADAALALLSDWFLESSPGVSLSAASHPKLRAFLRHVGLPDLQRADLAGPRLDARFAEARADATARVRDALFFQLAADGWREQVVTLCVNLPNGTSVFHRAVPVPAMAPSDYAEELMLEAVASVSASGSSSDLHRCAGIISDRFKSKALRDLEKKNYWMVNLSCQIHSFTRLVWDFARELSLFRSATAKSAKLAAFFNAEQTARSLLHKHQIQQLGHASLLRVAHVPFNGNGRNYRAAFEMLEDILNSAHPLHRAVQEDSYKLVCIDDSAAREIAEMVHSEAFWIEVDAVHSLVKLIFDMVREMEADRPLVGQCLPLWEELRSKVRDWCEKFNTDEGAALNVLEKRFRKSYHPAWSAAFILDPLYLVKDASGRYLPPFKCLTPDQEKDVDRLITRMVSREEAHLVLMELMKWRSDGLDPLYAQAVQVRQPDPSTGRMKVANKQSSRLVWETCLSELKSLGKVAVRLIFLHATSRGFRCTPSMVRWLCAPGTMASGNDRAHRLVFVAANSKLERRDFSSDEDKDAELLAEGDDDDVPGTVEP